MIRKIVEINEERCNGCGLCAKACHEGAIGMIEGKAKLLRDDYCDGLGDCLPVCPTNAISIIEKEALPYDEEAVLAHQRGCTCPGEQAKVLKPATLSQFHLPTSQLRQWPVQIQLVPIQAPYFHEADCLIAADCTAYAYGNFHEMFMKGKVTLIGCPKLDHVDYSEKLTMIFKQNAIKSITLTRMEVPCCGGLEYAVKQAIQNSGKNIVLKVVTIGNDGRILSE